MTAPRRSGAGVVRFYSFLSEGPSFLDDVLAGLSAPHKTVPPKYFYDWRGSKLFEEICELPEYYLTRVETGSLWAARRNAFLAMASSTPSIS